MTYADSPKPDAVKNDAPVTAEDAAARADIFRAKAVGVAAHASLMGAGGGELLEQTRASWSELLGTDATDALWGVVTGTMERLVGANPYELMAVVGDAEADAEEKQLLWLTTYGSMKGMTVEEARRTRREDAERAEHGGHLISELKSQPQLWTVGWLIEQRRGLIGVCPGCGYERPVRLDHLVMSGHGAARVGTLHLTCHDCKIPGQARVVWINDAGHASFNFATGQKTGSWKCCFDGLSSAEPALTPPPG